jgi:hypothetical protein
MVVSPSASITKPSATPFTSTSPPNVVFPLISTAPLISIVVAAICISVSATKSN